MSLKYTTRGELREAPDALTVEKIQELLKSAKPRAVVDIKFLQGRPGEDTQIVMSVEFEVEKV